MEDPYRSTTYETHPAPASPGTSTEIGLNKDYVRTLPAILKIVEIVLSLLTFICASVHYFGGSGWVNFVALSAFITFLISFLMYLFNFYGRIPGPKSLVELIIYAVFTLFYLIAAIVCAVSAVYAAAIGAATFFAFVATVVFGVDTFFQYRGWRSASADAIPATNVTTTTSIDQAPTY